MGLMPSFYDISLNGSVRFVEDRLGVRVHR